MGGKGERGKKKKPKGNRLKGAEREREGGSV